MNTDKRTACVVSGANACVLSVICRAVAVLFVLGILLSSGYLRAGQVLPVFLADNHAETFGWIARNFDVDEPHALVLVDAHSDASAAERSEEVREGLRRVPSEEARGRNVERWRAEGRIQAFNWIEPLMPRPVDRVYWLAGMDGGGSRLAAMQRDAVDSLDGRLEVEPRSAGSFAGRWETMDGVSFGTWSPGVKEVILAIDLDFFGGMEEGVRERVFEEIWMRAMDWPGLSGVAFSVSRPWLKDDAEADALVRMACAAVKRTRGAVLEIDASVDDRPDDSLRKQESSVPLVRWDAALASDGLKMIWFAMRDRIQWTDRKRDVAGMVAAWAGESDVIRIRPDHGEVDCDGVWRYRARDVQVVRGHAPAGATGRVRWFVLEPARRAYDLLPETGLGKSFSASPGRWVYERRRLLGETLDFACAAESIRSLGVGRTRIEAEVEMEGLWLPAEPIELRLSEGAGFRGALSECFRMPYVFGVGEVREGDMSGVETGWGSDCANFLIYAWRRNGVSLVWGDPGRLRAQLATKADGVVLDDAVEIRIGEVEHGIAVDFGSHVAAVWEDLDPVGILGGNDRVVHHLGGFPEIVTLAELAKDRPRFSLRVPRVPTSMCCIKVAGDVVLAGEEREVLAGLEKGRADLFLVNLEGIPSLKEPLRAQRFDFRFPKERLGWLRERGVDAVSLANNHAGDAHEAGLVEAIDFLRKQGIGVFGAGRNAEVACMPWKAERNGVRLAVFGVCLVEAMMATANSAGVARLPEHAGILEREIRKARVAGEQVVVLVHGGDEYKQQVNDDQRRWARWLVARGAKVIAGAHPHVVQRSETYGGAFVAHSLGNAVYPKSLSGAASGEMLIFEMGGDD